MYLLAHMEREIAGERRPLALQLMRRPWEVDRGLLAQYFPKDMVTQFVQIQDVCRRSLGLSKKQGAFSHHLVRWDLNAYFLHNESIRQELKGMALHVGEQFAGQAREDLHEIGKTFDDLSETAQAAFLSMYFFSDAFLYLLTKVISSTSSTYRMTIADTPVLREALRLYWFGHQASFHSTQADLYRRDATLEEIRRSGHTLEQVVRQRGASFVEFVDMSIDKYLSVHARFTHLLAVKDRMGYQAMRRRAELIAYLFLLSREFTRDLLASGFNPIRDLVVPGEYEVSKVMQAGFTQEEIGALLNVSAAQNPGDILLVESKSGKLQLGTLSLKYAFTRYLGPMLATMPTLGDWFDKAYIWSFLKNRVTNTRYVFGKQIDPGRGDDEKYDIDLVIADIDLERIYLCQIKHRISTLKPYLRDELAEYSMHRQLLGAVKQLDAARNALSSEKLLERVKDSLRRQKVSTQFLKKIDSSFLQKNSGFIIIHTIENLDFSVKDGIALYEWNTFRNLLRQERIAYSKEGAKLTHPDLSGVALDNPAAVSERLTIWHDQQMSDKSLGYAQNVITKSASFLQLSTRWEIKLWGLRLFSYRKKDVRYPLI